MKKHKSKHRLSQFQVAASAYKCKHSSYSNSDSDSHQHYDYASHDPIGIPDNLAHERMNTRSAVISPAYASNVPDDVKSAQLRLATQTRTESKVLSWKPYAESRIGKIILSHKSTSVMVGPCDADFDTDFNII